MPIECRVSVPGSPRPPWDLSPQGEEGGHTADGCSLLFQLLTAPLPARYLCLYHLIQCAFRLPHPLFSWFCFNYNITATQQPSLPQHTVTYSHGPLHFVCPFTDYSESY